MAVHDRALTGGATAVWMPTDSPGNRARRRSQDPSGNRINHYRKG